MKELSSGIVSKMKPSGRSLQYSLQNTGLMISSEELQIRIWAVSRYLTSLLSVVLEKGFVVQLLKEGGIVKIRRPDGKTRITLIDNDLLNSFDRP